MQFFLLNQQLLRQGAYRHNMSPWVRCAFEGM